MATRLPTVSRNAAANAVVDLADAGSAAAVVRIYTGAQPGNANDAASGTLLAELDMSDPAFGAASTGVATAGAIAATTGLAAGTAGWFRVLDSDDATIFDGDVTVTGGGGDMILNTTTISVGVTVEITAMTFTVPASE